MKIYVASSWRNSLQPDVVATLRQDGHEVYDFRNPPNSHQGGFHWSEIDAQWRDWDTSAFLKGLAHPIAKDGFQSDWQAMQAADLCVLVTPCGRSAHLEGGYFAGAPGKRLIIYLTHPQEPELMYKMAHFISSDLQDIRTWIRELETARAMSNPQ